MEPEDVTVCGLAAAVLLIIASCVPPLSCQARRGHEDYIFSLLTAYVDPPHGLQLKPHQHYNVYFPSNVILMPPPLANGLVEYEDDTVSTISQQAKDVASFLTWTSNPEQDERKLTGLKVAGFGLLMFVLIGYHKRFLFSLYKTRRVRWQQPHHTAS
jgi:ubiquinol-cytochrome c reductase cytochrome c1 subunit